MQRISFGQYIGALAMIAIYGGAFYFAIWLILDFRGSVRGLFGMSLAFVALYHAVYGTAKAVREA